MARPNKVGLSYFPLDVDFLSDLKVRRIVKACGKESIHILIALLAYIYRDDGYYVVWNDDLAFLVADEVGAKEGLVLELVNKALQVAFFSKKLFDDYNILTSKGIQERYIFATKERSVVELESDYLLAKNINRRNISIKPPNNLIKQPNNLIKSRQNKQSKVKESKVKESKVKNKESMPGADKSASVPEENPIITLTLNDKSEYCVFDQQIKNWQELYPAVDVMQELRKMKGWTDSNPQKRKTKKGISRFITNWLAREQDKGGVYRGQFQQQKSKITNNEFLEIAYEMEMEKHE